jgi:hypothetical protein
MRLSDTVHRVTRIVQTLGLIALLSAARTADAQAPDFDSVPWLPLGCAAGDAAGNVSPSAVDLVGDATHLAAYYAHDTSYLYFRYRVDGNPGGTNSFDQYSWTALMQVPSGNPYQYQYELSLNGKSDTIEVWANTNASNITFSPLFSDSAETKLFSQPVLTLPLARHLVASDGSTFGGGPDYFVDFAIPVNALVAQGVIATPADLDGSLFFPATSTNPNNFNKGHLDCPFGPGTALAIDKSVSPTVVPANATTPLAYTIAVRNDGPFLARGLVIQDPVLPGYLAGASVEVSADDPSVTWSVVSTTPLEVRVPALPVGKTVTVQLAAEATPHCNDSAFTNVATVFATNAAMVSDDAVLDVNFAAGGCAACATDAECDDSNACTTNACVAGACTATATPGCLPCAVDANCPDTGNACTAAVCTDGVCGTTPVPNCTVCAVDAECDDGDICTIDACGAGGTCTHTAKDGCFGGVQHEICGNCIDDDGDGLVDYDDPDCCDAPMPLDLRSLKLKSTPKSPDTKKMRLRAGYAPYTPADFDPMAGTTVQISDPSGLIFCQTMPAQAWKHPKAHLFRYLDKSGALAAGVKRGRFKMKKDGAVIFRARGRNVALHATDGHAVKVTVGVGGQCSQAITELRHTPRAMMFP